MYLPAIKHAVARQRYIFDRFSALLLEEIIPDGLMRYHFLLLVYRPDAQQPCLAAGSEYLDEEDAGNPILGVFTDTAHFNLGEDTALTQRSIFIERALAQALQQLELPADTLISSETLSPPQRFG